MFEMQRTYIEASQSAFESSLKLQKAASDAFLGSFESTKSLQKRGVDLTKRAAHSNLDAGEEALPADVVADLRAAVDEQYEALDEVHDDAWESFERSAEDAVDSYDELTAAQAEMVDELYESMLQINADAAEVADEAADVVEQ
jgi:hypothetical protein